MTTRYSRRQALQVGAATAAVTSVPLANGAARQTTPTSADQPGITSGKVERALAMLDDLVESAMAQTGVPGAAVAVVYDDTVVYERGFGVREVGKPETVTPETVFQLASMSKPISSTLVAAVVGDGTASWDGVAADLLPGFALSDPWLTSQITLRDLFSHRSGLPAYAGDGLAATFGYPRDESVERLRHVPQATSPRTAFAYTNLPLSVAAYAAAATTGQVWEDLAEERLFEPLGMTSTSYRFAAYLAQANKAAPHYLTREGDWALGEVTDADTSAPAGGVSSNLRDLAQWLRLHLATGVYDGNEVVAIAPLLETWRPQILEASPANPAEGAPLFYGLGWRLNQDDQGRLHVHHIGDFNSGFRTGVHMLPEAGLGIVVLTNAWPNGLPDGIATAFLELVDRGETSQDWVTVLGNQMLAGIEVVREYAPFPSGDAPANQPSLAHDAYTGTYTHELYGDVVVRDETGQLLLELGPLPTRLDLTHWDRDVFTYPLPPSGEVMLGRLGVQFLVGPLGVATALAFGLPSVGPDSTVIFLRTG